MFTVLIAEKEHIDAIREKNRLFFEPFLESKELAFCYWNPAGQNLQDSVPGLLDAVGRQKKWRAVIINNCTMDSAKLQNPYDLANCKELNDLHAPNRQLKEKEDPAEWEKAWQTYFAAVTKEKETIYKTALERPLQKLATWLCFRPEGYVLDDMMDRQSANDWALKELGNDELKASVKLELMERNQYKTELRIKEELRRDFVGDALLNVANPTEVHCISLRSAEMNFFNPKSFWDVHQDNEYSAFADRNMYFDKMRFMVFDLLPPTHRDFRTDYIRFLASVLIFASNPVPGSAMQARRLYRLESETDETPLCTLVTSYDRKLAATAEVIDGEMEIIRSEIPEALTDKRAEELFCTPQEVDILLDASCNPKNLITESDYGLFYDSPENEYHKWDRNYRKSTKELANIAKQQGRAIRKSAGYAQFFGEVYDVNINRLTSLQMDDVREYTDKKEDEMIASIPPDLTDLSRYTGRMETASEEIKKVLGQRMTQKTTFVLGGICLGLYLLCFLPFLFSNGSTPKTVTTAIILSGVMLGILLAVMFVVLLFLRSSVTNAVQNYNTIAREILNEIQTSMKNFSKYLSAFSCVRRGFAIQDYAQHNLDEFTKGLRIRKKHKEDIREKRAYLKEKYGDYLGSKSYCDEVMSRPYEYDFDQATEYTYPVPFLAGDSRQIEFISSGNYVTVPSSYVTRIYVRMEGLYE